VHVHLAAWSVDTNGNGTVTVTVRQLTHAAQLQRALARAGVPAIVLLNKGCLTSQNQSAFGKSEARFLQGSAQPAGYTITPSHIPHGDKLLVSVISATGRSSSGGLTHISGWGWGLVQAGQPLHCG
jgi:hypothetical protein